MKKLSKEVREYLSNQGKKGGKARSEILTPERRKEISVLANQAKKAKKLSTDNLDGQD